MKLDYEYFVHDLAPSGFATVEYKHATLGSVTRYVVLPYDKPSLIHRKVIENFPMDIFYGRWLEEQKTPLPEGFKGSFSIDFHDAFYDVIDEATGS